MTMKKMFKKLVENSYCPSTNSILNSVDYSKKDISYENNYLFTKVSSLHTLFSLGCIIICSLLIILTIYFKTINIHKDDFYFYNNNVYSGAIYEIVSDDDLQVVFTCCRSVNSKPLFVAKIDDLTEIYFFRGINQNDNDSKNAVYFYKISFTVADNVEYFLDYNDNSRPVSVDNSFGILCEFPIMEGQSEKIDLKVNKYKDDESKEYNYHFEYKNPNKKNN